MDRVKALPSPKFLDALPLCSNLFYSLAYFDFLEKPKGEQIDIKWGTLTPF